MPINRTPLISIILTSYNQKDLLYRAFNSLLQQTYSNIEIIIVDDCSTQKDTLEYLQQIKKQQYKNVIVYIQKQNVGIAKNKNTGFKLAKGEYISYLDGDDYYLPNKIEQEVRTFLTDINLDVVYSNFYIEEENSGQRKVWVTEKNIPPTGNIFTKVFSRQFPHNTLFRFELIKKAVLKDINYYDEKLLAYEDWDSRIRYSKNYTIGYSNNIGSVYFSNSSGISKRWSYLKHFFETERIFLKNIKLAKYDKETLNIINTSIGNNLLKNRKQIFNEKKFYSIKNLIKQFILIRKVNISYLIKTINGKNY